MAGNGKDIETMDFHLG
jgi:hypothetical protein